MAQQDINIGPANQGQGDTLFDAFTKVQSNFTELYTDESQGEVNSIVAGTGVSVSSATGDVTVTNTAPDQTVSLADGGDIAVSGTYPSFTLTNSAPNATHTGDVTGSGALTIANDTIDSDRIGVQYKTNVVLGSGENNLDFSAGQIFTKTISGATTLTFSNAVTGDCKLCYMAGDAPTLPTGNTISGSWVAGTTNVIQILYTGNVYLYSISQFV